METTHTSVSRALQAAHHRLYELHSAEHSRVMELIDARDPRSSDAEWNEATLAVRQAIGVCEGITAAMTMLDEMAQNRARAVAQERLMRPARAT